MENWSPLHLLIKIMQYYDKTLINSYILKIIPEKKKAVPI